jgi:hypothetical protein
MTRKCMASEATERKKAGFRSKGVSEKSRKRRKDADEMMVAGVKWQAERTAGDRRSLPACGWAGVRAELRFVYIARPLCFWAWRPLVRNGARGGAGTLRVCSF